MRLFFSSRRVVHELADCCCCSNTIVLSSCSLRTSKPPPARSIAHDGAPYQSRSSDGDRGSLQLFDSPIEENLEPKFPGSIKGVKVSLQRHLSNEIRSFSHSPARRLFLALYFNRLP